MICSRYVCRVSNMVLLTCNYAYTWRLCVFTCVFLKDCSQLWTRFQERQVRFQWRTHLNTPRTFGWKMSSKMQGEESNKNLEDYRTEACETSDFDTAQITNRLRNVSQTLWKTVKKTERLFFSQRKIRCVMDVWLITLGPHRMIGLFANMAPRNGRLDGHDEAMARDGRDFLVGKNVIQWA